VTEKRHVPAKREMRHPACGKKRQYSPMRA